MLIDSGADTTLLPRSIIATLGIEGTGERYPLVAFMTTGRNLAAKPRSAVQTSPGRGFIEEVQDVLLHTARPHDVEKAPVGQLDDLDHLRANLFRGFRAPLLELLMSFSAKASIGLRSPGRVAVPLARDPQFPGYQREPRSSQRLRQSRRGRVALDTLDLIVQQKSDFPEKPSVASSRTIGFNGPC